MSGNLYGLPVALDKTISFCYFPLRSETSSMYAVKALTPALAKLAPYACGGRNVVQSRNVQQTKGCGQMNPVTEVLGGGVSSLGARPGSSCRPNRANFRTKLRYGLKSEGYANCALVNEIGKVAWPSQATVQLARVTIGRIYLMRTS